MEILAVFLDNGKSEISIFIGDCLAAASKISRTNTVYYTHAIIIL